MYKHKRNENGREMLIKVKMPPVMFGAEFASELAYTAYMQDESNHVCSSIFMFPISFGWMWKSLCCCGSCIGFGWKFELACLAQVFAVVVVVVRYTVENVCTSRKRG